MKQRHNRIFPLSELATYPGIDAMDSTFWLPEAEDPRRRVWLITPQNSPEIAIDEEADFVSIAEENGHAFELGPGPAQRLHMFLPGRRYETEPVGLRGVITDRYRNGVPEGPADVDFRVEIEGEDNRWELGAASGYFTGDKRFRIPLRDLPPGTYRAVARSSDGERVIARCGSAAPDYRRT